MSDTGPTIGALQASARSRFAEAGLDDPAADAKVLVSGLFGLTFTEIVTRSDQTVDAEGVVRLEDAIARRLRHEPVHRILGEREFYGLPLRLSPATLEPRADTEILVDSVLPHLRRLVGLHGSIDILDMGTGTGAICLALLHECREAAGLGSDISADALATARGNAERNGLADRFRTAEGSWFTPISGRFHAIVSNPPYIVSDVMPTLAPEVRDFDPTAALDGGRDGLDAYRAIAADAAQFLHDDGVLGLEIGYDQRPTVTALFEGSGFRLIEAARDYGHNDRALIFAKGI
ncbi:MULTISPECIES: peptide chain release factor N(5)-glutamine methyltransferase [Rhizobium]|uniref:Release factor glutamine methyltransferase n=1 Tax=Rhizobium rhododendri TaxID=2506430 RepID=A0ABY8IF11_9HYPH|nr:MULTISPECIES: peptide chain release factor N(5)-glutamine methyltransferase [Rhizobium]MBZ5760981.1 peptide chain release factor N(5)-glutamine methyltransferase [Rhizobium sp. VS19-DR96]MBZ5765235.1 peptide chain release factor N(5)-glutamine methyltransferase [Rhizobium sp. VS19-DR129.2]MBZ5774802.1 peptide chain release factor N(5)-glutamine methyltransferase [Rhizobium sp. VS19-DRK62.2]MBZ5784816.1 peptide chain release factor N(5)-glutamine methyltransferase [Rhizobium sp. VS19-DR121]M